MTASEPAFPCPFCQSSQVTLVGGGLVFLHYRCDACAEVWTAMAAPRPAVLRPSSRASEESAENDWAAWRPADPRSRRPKFWRH